MARNRLKRILCMLLVIITVFSLSVTAYADGKTANSACSLTRLKNEIIKSFLSHENLLSKSILRAQFRTGAAAGAAVGCTTAAYMLNYSLQNSPADLKYDSNSKYAVQIMNSSECREIVNAFRNRAGNAERYTTNGSIALNSSPDLYLAYNYVSYVATGERVGNRWNITIKFTDTYDFDYLVWEDVLTDGPVIVAICNYAAYAQTIHAIVPYDIEITVKTSVGA